MYDSAAQYCRVYRHDRAIMADERTERPSDIITEDGRMVVPSDGFQVKEEVVRRPWRDCG